MDLAVSPPDGSGQQYLYVSYQGLPTANIPDGDTNPLDAQYGSGAVFIFNATAMLTQVTNLTSTTSGRLLLDQIPVDDIVAEPGGVLVHQHNIADDVQADFRSNYQSTDPQGFERSLHSGLRQLRAQQRPIALGGFPGGIAISNPEPDPIVYQHVANEGGSGTPGANLLLGVDLTPTNTITFGATDVDPVTGNVRTDDGDFYFSVAVTSQVSLYLKGNPDPNDPSAPAPVAGNGSIVQDVPDPRDPNNNLAQFENIVLTPGVYHTVITEADILSPDFATYTYTHWWPRHHNQTTHLTENAGTASGLIITQQVDDNADPVGQGSIDGVNLGRSSHRLQRRHHDPGARPRPRLQPHLLQQQSRHQRAARGRLVQQL